MSYLLGGWGGGGGGGMSPVSAGPSWFLAKPKVNIHCLKAGSLYNTA